MQILGRRFLFTRLFRLKHSMSTSIPQVRPVLDCESYSPVAKKARLDDGNSATGRGEEEDAVIIKAKTPMNAKKKKKRKDPPLPESCSPGDVLYREIRKLLGEDAVNDVTNSGNAFNAPYLHGEEAVVKVEMLGSGGESVKPFRGFG